MIVYNNYIFYEDYNKNTIHILEKSIRDYFNYSLIDYSQLPVILPTTWLAINLNQLRKNYEGISHRIGSDVGIISILKADAYGHGLIPIAETLNKLQTSKIGLASIEEIKILRNRNIQTPILLLYPPLLNQLELLLDLDVEITMADYNSILLLNKLAKKRKKIIKIHVQIDTGLNRFGVKPDKAMMLIVNIAKLKNISLEGIWTHFLDAENDALFTKKQFEQFLKILKQLSDKGIKIPFIHTANSAAISNFPKSYDKKMYAKVMPDAKILVRPGCLLYGTYRSLANRCFSTPPIISSIVSHIIDIAEIQKGESVGYFRTFIANKRLRIATLPIGWGNYGYLSKDAFVMADGKYARGIGLISSNNMAIDITNNTSCRIGTKTYLVKSDDKKISLEEVAKKSGMFLNQFISSVGAKIPRSYFDN